VQGEFPVLHNTRGTSIPYVKLEATHLTSRCCSHDERFVMQVYEGWGNYGRRFWHCPLARVSYGNDICSSSTMLGLLTFVLGIFQFSDDDDNCGFSQWVDPSSIDPYQDHINHLHDIVIYNLKRRLDKTLSSPDRLADNQCCPCATCTCECRTKMRDWSPPLSPPPPPRVLHAIPCSPAGSRTTRLRM
jgi:hypothetical protein